MLNPTSLGCCAGAVLGLALVLVGAFQRGALDLKDVGPAGMVFITCTNILPPIVLFFFVLTPSEAATLPGRLHGYEVFIALAAFVSFITSILTIAGAFMEAANNRR